MVLELTLKMKKSSPTDEIDNIRFNIKKSINEM